MSTIIEEFVIALGFDASGVDKGAKNVQDDLKKVQESSNSTSKSLSLDSLRAADGFRSLRNEVAGVLILFAGANSLKKFASDMISSDAATGRLATSLGVSTKELSAWQIAVEKAGGTSKDADAAFQTISSIFENVRLRGDLSQGAELAGLGVTDLSDTTKAMMQFAAARDRMSAPEFQNRLQHLGISQGTINLLTQGSLAVAKSVDDARKSQAITDDQAKAAQEFESALVDLKKTIETMMRPELTELLKGFISVVGAMKDAHALAPALEVSIGALGLAAAASASPWLLMASAIGAVVLAYRDLQSLRNMSADERKKFDAEGERLRAEGWAEFKDGNVGGLLGTIWHGFSDRAGLGDAAGVFGIDQARIKRTESHGDYNAVAFNERSPKPVTSMTLGELYDWQRTGLRARTRGRRGPSDKGSTGVGAYQFESGTLAENAAALYGPGWRSHMFNPQTQDEIAQHLYDKVKRDPRALANTWATFKPSVPRTPTGGAPGGSHTTNVGPITINTAATDGRGIARDLGTELQKRGMVYQAQSGMTP